MSKPLFIELDETVLLGGVDLANDQTFLVNKGITHIINCVSSYFPNRCSDSISYLNLNLMDSVDQDLSQSLLLAN